MEQEKLPRLCAILRRANRIVGFTGAGISTDSGIPDYRSQGGIWSRFQPVYFQEFLASREKRLLYWQRKRELWQGLGAAHPNQGHLFFKHLHDQGKLLGLITQNIDGLHERSGLPKAKLINLHGNTLETLCLGCGRVTPTQQVFDTYDVSVQEPRCAVCKGLLKPNTVSFGQPLDQANLQKAYEWSLTCDCMIVMGSTLSVQPAAAFPLVARQHDRTLVIINLSRTELDELADLVFHLRISEFVAGWRNICR